MYTEAVTPICANITHMMSSAATMPYCWLCFLLIWNIQKQFCTTLNYNKSTMLT